MFKSPRHFLGRLYQLFCHLVLFFEGVCGSLCRAGGLALPGCGLLGGLGGPFGVVFGAGLMMLSSALGCRGAFGLHHRYNR